MKTPDVLRITLARHAFEGLAVSARSYPKEAVREEYTWQGWIPLWKEPMEGNYLGLDLDPRKPLESSLTGSSLSMVPYKPPIDYDDDFFEIVQKIFQLSLENGLVLAQFEVRFRRETAGWKSELVFETAANKKALIDARKPIDAEIRAALIVFVGTVHPDWERVTLDFDVRPDVPRSGLKVVLVYPRPIRLLEPSAELRALFDRMQALHSTFGRRLHTAHWGVESDRPKKISTRFYYG